MFLKKAQVKNFIRNVAVYPIYGVLFCLLTSFSASSETATEVDLRVNKSRATVKTFAGKLVKELKQALEEGGPVKAIKVCNIEAPQIAGELSEQHKLRIGRTSLKIRNPNNEADAWEQAVLQQFEQRKLQGEDIATLEYFEETEKGFRYMKAIPTKGLCLACHGEALSESVKTTLTEYYPNDKATGFKTGDIRGAFTLIQKD
ncbi:MAG: DUF3365 domain-containing protein [Proteobacteria bacterium]|nr:DUF3365 domain-containing protein [Pseudomonadota bacterium]NOG60040.1 DUF3365 domain-containing protein [Pseudomonadota bacterium]